MNNFFTLIPKMQNQKLMKNCKYTFVILRALMCQNFEESQNALLLSTIIQIYTDFFYFFLF